MSNLKEAKCPFQSKRIRNYPDCWQDCPDTEKCPFKGDFRHGIKKEPGLEWAVPKALKIPTDPLQLRVDFHLQAVVVYAYNRDTTTRKIVSAMDIVHALASELTYTSGILPRNTIWWANTSAGPMYAIYEEPAVRKLAIQFEANKSPKRYSIPLPGCIFMCQPGHAPRVFAVKRRPVNPGDHIFHAPFPNMSSDGTSCAGTNAYPIEPGKIPESFWLSFFTAHGNLEKRSKKHSQNLIRLWEELEGQKKYPLDDLVQCGTVADLTKISHWR